MLLFLGSVAVISLSGVMMPGPVFAVTIARSYKSQFAGIRVAVGHALIEIPLILLIYYGFASFFQDALVQKALFLVGGAVLVWMGIRMLRARGRTIEKGKDLPRNSIFAGVTTTALNPYFILWWATVGSMLIMKSLSFGLTGLILFAVVHLLCDFGWLAFVSVLVHRTKSLWGGRVQQGLLIASSLLLIGFGGWFLSSGFQVTV
jgi:threonine/homoserine/homoserine lactone efflux protein